MKLFFDFFPIIAFFIAYKVYDIYAATIVAIVAIFLQIGITFAKGQKPEMMHWITLVLITVMGGATLFLHNEMFIKWKPTAVYWVLALILGGSQFFTNKTAVQRLLEKNITLPQKVWKSLNFGWCSFFSIMGILNLYVVYQFDTNTWVNFKLFGTLGLTILFVIIQGIYLAPFIQEPSDTKERNGL
jgi:intracellular septation protein